jgi:RNase P/RNase MRP subunit POP5
MKLKIKPSAKTKRRYLLLEAKSKQEIEKTILEYIGILGYAKAAPLFVKSYKEKTKNKIILSVERSEITNIRAAFEVSQAKIKVLKVSGTLKGLQK